jgi:hypothetical protein
MVSDKAEKVSKHLDVCFERLFHQTPAHEFLCSNQVGDRSIIGTKATLARIGRYIPEAIELEKLCMNKQVLLKEGLHTVENIRFPISPLPAAT